MMSTPSLTTLSRKHWSEVRQSTDVITKLREPQPLSEDGYLENTLCLKATDLHLDSPCMREQVSRATATEERVNGPK